VSHFAGEQVLDFWVPGPPKTKGSLQPRARRCHCCDKCKGYVGKPQLRDTEGSDRWRKLVAYEAERTRVTIPRDARGRKCSSARAPRWPAQRRRRDWRLP
jgi:hypothetical protein